MNPEVMAAAGLGRCMRDFEVEGSALQISAPEVTARAECGPGPRWGVAVAAAIAEVQALSHPRARVRMLEDDELSLLLIDDTPVLDIARAGYRWAFVATLGCGPERQVREHFDQKRFLEGVLLDAAASVAVEALCGLLEQDCTRQVAHHSGEARCFSPGYCAWALAAQAPLLSLLGAHDLGITLEPSLFMLPLKTVSGMVVHALSHDLQVPSRVCAACTSRRFCRRHPHDIKERREP